MVGSDDSDSNDSKGETNDEESIVADPAELISNSEGADIIEEVAVENPADPGVETRILDGSTHAKKQSPVVQEAIGDEPAD